MSREDVIANRYAQGLAEYAGAAGLLEKTREDLGVLLGIFSAEDSEGAALRRALSAPSVPMAEKVRLAGEVVRQAGLGDAAGNFLTVLIRRRRLDLLTRAIRRFGELAGGMAEELAADVRTARPLTEDQSRRLAEALSRAFDAKVRVSQTVDPALLAGARVTVGGTVIDGAVLGRLEEMKRRLTSGAWDRSEEAGA